MIRSHLLSVLLLFTCVTSLNGMVIKAPPKKAKPTFCGEIRDVFCRGFVKPTLCAMAVAALLTYFDENMYIKEGDLVHMKMAVAGRFALGGLVMAFSLLLNNMASLLYGHVPYVTNKYLKCGYAALALYLMLNSNDVSNALFSK